ncbi:MAG: hypothetical protein GEV13_17940 [Rhodospirillales bacterium]|nr:hypothetical protein [Rhodospirillales bacterium]
MYTVDRHDRVEELKDLPQQSGGAPVPLLLAEDSELVLAYLTSSSSDEVAIVEFDLVAAHYFGPPNDEALSGHPLYKKGLRAYGAYEVKNSSWIRALERMNRVHPNHRPTMYSRDRHFIFAFHDTAFECVAHGIRNVTRLA